MTTKKQLKFDFEKALLDLENIVKTLQNGGTNLEKSVDLFTKGINLTKKCKETLDNAEQQVKILTGKQLVDFNKVTNDTEEVL